MRYQTSPSFKRLARFHFWVMFFAFVSYLGFGFTLGPEFFKHDILRRITALADDIVTVTATVLGPPVQPIVTATPSCVSGAPRITLDWADDAATTTWDIERDSTTLTTGLVTSRYIDTVVTANTAYSYIVTAFGPMFPGSSVSASVSATAPDCPDILPPATVTIQTIGHANVAVDRSSISVSQERPRITGTTNIPNAIIDVAVTNPSIQARFAANAAGYFSWIPPIGLDTGNHILSVTATDPNDGVRMATDGFVFRTKDTDHGSGSGSSGSQPESIPSQAEQAVPPVSQPDFSVEVNGGSQLVFQGDALEIVLSIDKPFPTGTVFHGYILDNSGKEVYDLGELAADPSGTHFDGIPKDVALTTGKDPSSDAADGIAQASGRLVLRTMKRIPLSLDPGAYRIRVDAMYEGHVISREVALTIKAWPLIRFGGGNEITYPQVASLVGTIFLVLLSLFILFLLLFVREYWLYLHHLRFVDERSLKRLGLIGPKRREVAQ